MAPPTTETMGRISAGIRELARMSGAPATSLMQIVLASDTARATGVRGPVVETQEQAEAVLGLLRDWWRMIRREKRKRERS